MTTCDKSGRREETALVIPAFNEATRIEPPLRAALATTGFSRILVVDDGSTDGTSEVVQRIAGNDARFSLIRLELNRGKAGAMVAGAEAAGTPIVAFLDADLLGLQPSQIEALFQPVSEEEAEMTVGVFLGGRRSTDRAHRWFPYLSGQRCLRWSRFSEIDGLESFRSGIEVALSLHAALHGYRVRQVVWRGVTHATKPEKAGPRRGLYLYLRMNLEIARAASQLLAHEIQVRRRRPLQAARAHRGAELH